MVLPAGGGTRYDVVDGALVRIRDRTGAKHARVTWANGALVEIAAGGAVVRGAIVDDALLGRAHEILIGGAVVTTMSEIDWARPAEIPAIAAPAKLAGTGGAIMNALAVLAAHAGVTELRYAGPYPTSALHRTLLRCFRTTATEDAFTADLLARAARVARDPLPHVFVPAPHERIAIAGGHVELRDGLERAVLGGTSYERDRSPARLVERDDGIHAEVWFGDAPWADVATLDPDGALLAGPHPLPASTSDVVGKAFPPPLRAAIAELVAEAVPAPLAADAHRLLVERDLRWADLGARAAARDDAGFAVHAALWERIGPLGLARLALALAEALAPVVSSAVVATALAG